MKRLSWFPDGKLWLVVVVSALLWGCTMRYSQTLVGRIERVKPGFVEATDSGVEIGLNPAAGLVFSEPQSATELITVPCEAALTEVDYRGTWYAFYISVNLPEVRTSSYCVSE